MRVNVDTSVFRDPRVRKLARRLEISEPETIGRLLLVWAVCYEQRTPLLLAEDVDISADLDGFADAMISAGLAAETDEGVHVKGVSERIEFLERQADRGRKGGQSRGIAPAQKQTLTVAEANAKRVPKRSLSTRSVGSEAYTLTPDLALDLDQAPDQAPDLDPKKASPGIPGDQRLGTVFAEGSQVRDFTEVGKTAVVPVVSAEKPQTAETGSDSSESPKGKPGPKPRPLPDQAVTLAYLMLEFVSVNNPHSRLAKAPERVRNTTAERWAETIDKIQRIDRFTWGEIEGMITWCQRDSFWRGVILGADNLRDKWDKMAAQRNSRRPSVNKGPTQLALDEIAELEKQEREQEQPE